MTGINGETGGTALAFTCSGGCGMDVLRIFSAHRRRAAQVPTEEVLVGSLENFRF
jgi:hypothetical protein